MALALYRKYRPRTFAEVIGQEHVTEPLSQALRSGRLHHAYLFSGPRGCGKTSSARILARSLNCEQGPTPDPCGVCASCKSLMNDGTGSIDVIEIDAASHGGVDDARELREKAFFAPASSRYKIYVIDEAHMVSPAGFNALLKLVEEPPDYVKFIFATTEPEKVLGTIRSRTHHYPFRLIPPAVLRPYLQQLTEAEGVHVEPAVLPLVVRAGGGSVRDSLSVLDQLIAGAGPEGVSYTRAVALLGVTDVALIDEMCDALAAGDGAAAYATIDRVAEAGHDPRRFASDLLERFRDLIILQQVPDAVTKGLIDGPADQLDAMSAQAIRLGPATLSRCADIVHNGLVEMRGTTAPRLLLELITARMLLPGADDTTGALLQRLERMERRLTLTSDPETVRAPAAPGTSSAPPASPQPEGTPGAPVAGGGGISAARAAAAAAVRRASGVGESLAPPAAAGPDAAFTNDGSATPGERGSVSPEERSIEDVSAGSGDAAAGGGKFDGESTPVGRVSAPGIPPSADARVAGQPHAVSPVPPQGQPVQPVPAQARRPEPSAVLPDAPEELPADTAAAPGQLTAAAVREVWPEIISDVGRKSKKVAALASGATVRDLDGQTVVLTFRFPAHAKMVSEQPHLIVDALYEALGGRWQIRCEVAGEAGGIRADGGAPQRGTSAPTQSGSVQGGLAQGGLAQGGPAHGGPAQSGPGQSGPGQGGRAQTGPAESDPARGGREQGGAAAGGGPASNNPASSGPASNSPAANGPAANGPAPNGPAPHGPAPHGPALSGPALSGPDQARPANGGPGAGGSTASASARSAQTTAPARPTTRPPEASPPDDGDGDDWPEPAKPGGLSAASLDGDGDGSAGRDAPPAVTDVRPSRVAVAETTPPAGRAANGAPGSGRAAARAAAAAGAARQAGAKPAAAPANAAPVGAAPVGAAPVGAAPVDAWSDGSPTEEAPYDPEYDGPPRAVHAAPAAGSAAGSVVAPASASFEGFDPGDEPLDDVIDEKTARQSSEQQAMQLLQDAFGAEKISES